MNKNMKKWDFILCLLFLFIAFIGYFLGSFSISDTLKLLSIVVAIALASRAVLQNKENVKDA